MYYIFVELLQRNGVSTYQVSKATGIAQSVFSSWKNGIRKPKADNLKKIADYFGVSTDYLLGRDENAPPRESRSGAFIVLDIYKSRVSAASATAQTHQQPPHARDSFAIPDRYHFCIASTEYPACSAALSCVQPRLPHRPPARRGGAFLFLRGLSVVNRSNLWDNVGKWGRCARLSPKL